MRFSKRNLPKLASRRGNQDQRLFLINDAVLIPHEAVFKVNSVSLDQASCIFDGSRLRINFSHVNCSLSLLDTSLVSDIKFYFDSWLSVSTGAALVQLDLTSSLTVSLVGCSCISVTYDTNIDGACCIELVCSPHIIEVE